MAGVLLVKGGYEETGHLTVAFEQEKTRNHCCLARFGLATGAITVASSERTNGSDSDAGGPRAS